MIDEDYDNNCKYSLAYSQRLWQRKLFNSYFPHGNYNYFSTGKYEWL